MFKPKVQSTQKPDASKQPEPVKTDSVNTFSDDEIRARAYQIYQSRGGNTNNADEDWSQAETELTELLHAK